MAWQTHKNRLGGKFLSVLLSVWGLSMCIGGTIPPKCEWTMDKRIVAAVIV